MHVEPILGLEEVEPYYTNEYWHQELSGTDPALVRLIRCLERRFLDYRMRFTMKPMLEWVPPDGRVLDVGCGSGDMLNLLAAANYDVYGVEVSKHAVEYAQRIHDAKVVCGTLEEAAYPKGFFDAMTFYHVFEHLQSPRDTLREAHRILKPGGLILIEVPNIESLGFRIFAAKWQPLDVPVHLYDFSPHSLGFLLSKSGFRIVHVSHFSARASCATWVLSVFPFLHPRILRKRERLGRCTTLLKIIYFGLQSLALPLALGAAWLKKGDIITVAAVRED